MAACIKYLVHVNMCSRQLNMLSFKNGDLIPGYRASANAHAHTLEVPLDAKMRILPDTHSGLRQGFVSGSGVVQDSVGVILAPPSVQDFLESNRQRASGQESKTHVSVQRDGAQLRTPNIASAPGCVDLSKSWVIVIF